MLFGTLAGPQLWAVALASDGSAVSSWPPACVDDPVMIITGLATPCTPEPPTTAVGLGAGRAYPVLTKSTVSSSSDSGASISAAVVRYHSLYYLFFTGAHSDTGDAVVHVGISATPLQPYVDFNGAAAGDESLAPTIVLASESPRYEKPTSLGVGMYLDDENLAQFVLSFEFFDSTDSTTKLGGSHEPIMIRTPPPPPRRPAPSTSCPPSAQPRPPSSTHHFTSPRLTSPPHVPPHVRRA